MDALNFVELGAKAGRAYVRAIRQAYRDAKAVDPQSDYYASRLGVAEEGGEALEPRLWGCNRCDGPLRPADQLPGGLCPSCVEYYDGQIEDALAEELAAPQVPSSSAGRGVGSPGVSAGAEEPAPPGGWPTADLAELRRQIAELSAFAHARRDAAKDAIPFRWHGGRAAAFDIVLDMLDELAVGVGATPTPKPAEAAETFPQYQNRKGEKC